MTEGRALVRSGGFQEPGRAPSLTSVLLSEAWPSSATRHGGPELEGSCDGGPSGASAGTAHGAPLAPALETVT